MAGRRRCGGGCDEPNIAGNALGGEPLGDWQRERRRPAEQPVVGRSIEFR
jgi:hypothetical protein